MLVWLRMQGLTEAGAARLRASFMRPLSGSLASYEEWRPTATPAMIAGQVRAVNNQAERQQRT